MSESPPAVGIVVVTHNLQETLRATLASCLQIDYPAFSIVVVDNASTDGSVAMVRQDFPQVHLIANPVGLGYAQGASQGMEYLAPSHRYLLSLSNDVTVAPDILTRMVAAAEADLRIGVIGSKVYFFDPPDLLWHAGAHVHPWHGHAQHFGWKQPDAPRYNQVRECDYVTGCGYFLRASVARQLGFLKSDLVFYFEDADFCYRARALGYKVIYLPTAKVWHKTATTLGKNRGLQLRYGTRNNLYLIRQHRVGPLYPCCLWTHLLLVCPLKMALYLGIGRWKNARGIWRGIRDWRQGHYGMIAE